MKVQISTMLIIGEKEIPVGVAGATTDTREIKFNNIHDCGTEIKNGSGGIAQTAPPKTTIKVSATKQKAFCPACQVEVESTVKGFEYAKGMFLIFTDEELDTIKPSALKTIQVSKFVPNTAVTRLMTAKSYFLTPNPSVPASYGQLYAALSTDKLTGIGSMNLWGKEQPCAVYADQSFSGHSVLMMQLLYLQEDMVLPDFTAPIPDAAAKKAMKELVTGLAGTLEPSDLVSAQRERLNKLMAEKLLVLQQPEPKPELTEALKPSRKKKVAT